MSDALSPTMTKDGAIARVTLRRPEKANRLEPDDLTNLSRYFAEAGSDDAVRVIVICAQGRHFCGGYDTSKLASVAQELRPGDGSKTAANPFEPFVDSLHAVNKPVIAAIQGGIYGGAIDLVLACDFRIGTRLCEMRMPALQIGFLYYTSGLERYISRLGLQNTRRIFMTAQVFSADEMLQMGVLDEVHASAEAMRTSVDALAQRLAGMAPLAMSATKRAIEEISLGRRDRELALRTEAELMRSADFREGIAALKAHRSPSFTGK